MRCQCCGSTVGVTTADEGTQSYDPFAETLAESISRWEAMFSDLEMRGDSSTVTMEAMSAANKEFRAHLAAWRANRDAG